MTVICGIIFLRKTKYGQSYKISIMGFWHFAETSFVGFWGSLGKYVFFCARRLDKKEENRYNTFKSIE